MYANNFNDSGMYVGACQQVCDMTIDHAWMEYNALGYSGTNSGGAMVIENSQFDNNQDGVDTNTQIDGDPPAPQNGDCPDRATSPITHTHSCWVFIHNYVHNNNNPDSPAAGAPAAGPTGTGMTVSGGRNDTVMDNTFVDNGAWGTCSSPTPTAARRCTARPVPGLAEWRNPASAASTTLRATRCWTTPHVDDGYFGNPSNSDFGQIVFTAGQPQNCFAGNIDPTGSAPADLEQIQPKCGPSPRRATPVERCSPRFCATRGSGHARQEPATPKPTGVVMHPLPKACRHAGPLCRRARQRLVPRGRPA